MRIRPLAALLLATAIASAGTLTAAVARGQRSAPDPSAAPDGRPGVAPDSITGPDASTPADAPGTLDDWMSGADAGSPESKLGAGLSAVVRDADPADREVIVVQSLGPVDLARFADRGRVHAFTWPAGEHVAVLEAAARDIPAIAALPGVYRVDGAVKDSETAGGSAIAGSIAVSRPPANASSIASSTGSHPASPATSASPAPDAADPAAPRSDGWWDVRAGHGAREAWEMGYRGEGVRVAVLDFAVDFGHPDLQDTWAVLPSGPYAGWPQAFDPYAGYLRAVDLATGAAPEDASTRTGAGGRIDLYQDSAVTEREVNGAMRPTACFKPRVQRLSGGQLVPTMGDEACDFVVPGTSRSGGVRYGHHPDAYLRPEGARAADGTAGEFVGVLLVDEGAAGRYDTVYVDLDNDRDFSDEKPMTQASPLGWRDLDGDAIADVSAGLLYFIADGAQPMPGSWLWGLGNEIPAAGRMIGIQYATGDHGTLCASNIIAQGRLAMPKGRELRFRDLPGDGQPAATNMGMAPGAKLISVGSVYDDGPLFPAAWRYIVFGESVEVHDDDIQVASNSYGFSNIDQEGWEPDSRLIDFYVRKYSPATMFVKSTGNGAPGYGTIAPPMPSVSLNVAASTQYGSTGTDSITDTTQITYGDIVPFSNRGPAASGQNGPDIAADGSVAAGAEPLNLIHSQGLNGTYANATWGGTSRAGPVAAGGMALVYQAFKTKNGRWPRWDESKSILLAGARYAAYDTFTMGAGVLDAGDAVRIASGGTGVHASPSEWTAGGYRGVRYPAFASIVEPGARDTQVFTLRNPSDKPIQVRLSAQTPRRIGHHDGSLTTDRTAESPVVGGMPGYMNHVPDYLVPVDRATVPAGTELMVARVVQPMSEFDVNADLTEDNKYSMAVLQHTDIDGDGKLWDDRNRNRAVNYAALSGAVVELQWAEGRRSDGATEGDITAKLPEEGLTAEIAWYGLGCSNPDGTPPLPAQEVTEKIALIQRGICTFSQKILNAQSAGAVGVVMITDQRPAIAMGGDGTGIRVPGVMVANADGVSLQAILEAGTTVTATMRPRPNYIRRGLDGSPPLVYGQSELDRYEYQSLTNDIFSVRNNWALSVHHPLERWSDGLYLALSHDTRSDVVTNTHFTTRLDFYAFRDWPALSLSATTLTIPAGGEATFEATLSMPADAPNGGVQGAIFVDHARGAGDVPVSAPGGYELPDKRVVIPVNATVARRYDWRGSLELGGSKAFDRDAPYNLGAVFGGFHWNWRPEAGDWRFFFVDADDDPAPGTYWLFRTTWDDAGTKEADIDTRVFGPTDDRFSNPSDPANADPANPTGAPEDASDPAWYGPYTLDLLARSPYLVLGGFGGKWPFNTSTGRNEDWLVAPARGGLHEVMLHNVLFSGRQIEMPFAGTVSSIRLAGRFGTGASGPATGGADVTLVGDGCSTLEITSQMDLPEVEVAAYGLGLPEKVHGTSAKLVQAPTDTDFKKAITLARPAGWFHVALAGTPGDDLDLYILRDANGDGTFDLASELVGSSAGPTHIEDAVVPGVAPAGAYEVWVHAAQLPAGAETSSPFDLTIETASGDALTLDRPVTALSAGVPAIVAVCARPDALPAGDGPAQGRILVRWPGLPTALPVRVTWWRKLPAGAYLPAALQGFDMGAEVTRGEGR